MVAKCWYMLDYSLFIYLTEEFPAVKIIFSCLIVVVEVLTRSAFLPPVFDFKAA